MENDEFPAGFGGKAIERQCVSHEILLHTGMASAERGHRFHA